MNHTLQRATLMAASIALATVGGLSPADAAPAHPLGNFTVNYHTGLRLHPDRIDATVVVDRAEIATLQERADVDDDHDATISPTESRAYAEAGCSTLADQLHAAVREAGVTWRAVSSKLTYEPGEAGLETSRLTCAYTTAADLSRPADIGIRTNYATQRIGWREMTVSGDGVRVSGTSLSSVSRTDELRHYPRDPAAGPLDQRAARLHTVPGTSARTSPGGAALPGAGWFDRVLGKTSAVFDSLVGARELTVPIGLLALLLALILGASHAVLPGHGKTIMASYLAGRRGTRRDAVTVGATVTLTHTAGVLVLGLALPVATHLAGETVLTWLGAASGLIVTGIGLWLLASALRNKPHHGHHHHHGEGHDHGHQHSHHGHHGHENHDPTSVSSSLGGLLPRRRTPQPGRSGAVATLVRPTDAVSLGAAHHHTEPRRAGRGGLIAMGIAGGLVPSPSALVVLLGAVALGRTAFGVLLVIAYGLGMAGTLTLVGLLLVGLRERLEARLKSPSGSHLRAVRVLARLGPVATALLVVIVGLGLTARAAIAAA
ncbi:nickel transporter [Streptomyces sp. BH-SS-21]|uniref:Nickel transporter n=1 Tax=Streptomyces liliiviolaceus TaxID=2823109 RepID=A0A940XZ14_9ACTN|nr:nickel transporter [Streptomyces liliiviolaceus]MBQ0850297.1 nickel transporter [Streptomyces liliiviolaceus]